MCVISQLEVKKIPEYSFPLSTDPDNPFSSPPAPAPAEATVSVFIPFYPSSQFWLSYSVIPPHPPGSLYYFKLYIKGKEMVSWGCGEEDDYRGRTMFGMYAARGGERLERRSLCFGSEDCYDPSGWGRETCDIEVKVFRARERIRIGAEVQNFTRSEIGRNAGRKQKIEDGCEIKSVCCFRTSSSLCLWQTSLVKGGLLPHEHPQRFYKYALLDPLDKPYATFRWYLRSWSTPPFIPFQLSQSNKCRSPPKPQRRLLKIKHRLDAL